VSDDEAAPNRAERMSDFEALMWSLESDPHLSSTFANLTFMDRSPDRERLRNRMWHATRVVPRLRRRVGRGMGPIAPRWEEDPDFDLDRHLRRVDLPAGTTETEVRALAAAMVLEPFDPDRPLWQFTVFDGLDGGRSAMVQKMHHSITDGKGGIRLSVAFVDLERDAPVDPGWQAPPPRTGRARSSGPGVAGLAGLAGLAGVPALLTGALGDVTRRNVDLARRLTGATVDRARDPARVGAPLVGLPADTLAAAQSVLRQFDLTASPMSPLWTGRSLERRLEVFQVPFDAVKAQSERLGVSVNDLFVAAAAGGAGRYHRARDVDVPELRMAMPISTRTDRSVAGNAFAITRTKVSLDADPAARLAAIHERLAVTKSERVSVSAGVASLARLLPPPAVARVARQQAMAVDFTTSNVRAAPFDLYLAGALMESNYPLGPIAGTAWNLTTMSYRGHLDLGLHVDAGAVDDPGALAQDIQDSFVELLDLGARRRRPRAR
jgi:WS/DGAT/MGAT family acyltransferase